MMNDAEVDDVAFLTEDAAKRQSLTNRKKDLANMHYSSCTKQQALIITGGITIVVLIIALIAAFARPFPRCPIIKPPTVNETGGTTEPPEVTTQQEQFPWNDIRLPSFIVPHHYEIFLHPDLTSFTSTGNVSITFSLKQSSSFIVLHAKSLNIISLYLTEPDLKKPDLKHQELIPKHDQLYAEFETPLKENTNYTLAVIFELSLQNDLSGFYLSSYTTSNGTKKYLATTQFEPTSARKAFPCFDEPAMKATFQLTMQHSSQYRAFFNTEQISVTPADNNDKVTAFKPTLRMSTYLVAFVLCDFLEVTRKSTDLELRVIVPAEQFSQANFALDVASEVIKFYNRFFDIPYPMKKLDLIAIPDFGPGAMENWGLITFRMSSLLYDEKSTPVISQENVAYTIVHEIAHQWFGNLVTMAWWDDLWLNEGFATFMEYVSVNELYPQWKIMDQFTYASTQGALDLDSLRTSHPISAHVTDPAEIDAIFDSISYNKGSAILYMLENFLGAKKMQNGLTHYLNTYRFSNARTEDLWNAFTNVTSGSINVGEVMDTWTRQKGYPLVTVTASNGILAAKQTRFQLVASEDDEVQKEDISTYGYKWYVPLTLFTDQQQEMQLYWMNRSDVEVSFPGKPKWIKANINQTGFYRVNYDKENWIALTELLMSNHTALHAADRAGLMDDAFILARAGILNETLLMNLTLYLEKERDFVPWATSVPHLQDIRHLIEDSPFYPLYRKHLLKLIRPTIKDLGWKDEGTNEIKKLRAKLLMFALILEEEEVREEATKLFLQWMKDGTEISPNLKDVVYRAGIGSGSAKEWDHCWNLYQTSQVPSEKALLLKALGYTRDIWQLKQYLQYSLDSSKIKSQDTHTVIGMAAANPIGQLTVWQFVRLSWETIYNMFKESTFALDHIIADVLYKMKTNFEYNEAKEFFKKMNIKTGQLALQQSLERIRANIFWKTNIESQLNSWLQAVYKE